MTKIADMDFNKQYDFMSDDEIRGGGTFPLLFGQPYIVRRPNDPLKKIKAIDSRNLPIGSAIDDLVRMGKFAISPKGIIFGIKQLALQTQHHRPEARVWNPIGTYGSIVPFISLDRIVTADFWTWTKENDTFDMSSASVNVGSYNSNPLYSKWITVQDETKEEGLLSKAASFVGGLLEKVGMVPYIPEAISKKVAKSIANDDFKLVNKSHPKTTPLARYEELMFGTVQPSLNGDNKKNAKLLQGGKGTYGFGNPGNASLDRSNRYKSLSGTSDRVNSFPYGTSEQIAKHWAAQNLGLTAENIKTNSNWPDLVPFKIHDVFNDKFIILRSFISGLADNPGSAWSEKTYIGRATKNYVYTGASRTVAFSIKTAAFTRDEMKPLYQKINALVGLNYPSYRDNKMVAPFTRVTLGSLLDNTFGYFSNINITYDDDFTWNIDKIEDDQVWLPLGCSISFEYVIVGDGLLQNGGKHIFGLPDSWDHDENNWIRKMKSFNETT